MRNRRWRRRRALLFSDGEILVGIINGSNATFTIAFAPSPAASLDLYLNGLLMKQGTDYTVTGMTHIHHGINHPANGGPVARELSLRESRQSFGLLDVLPSYLQQRRNQHLVAGADPVGQLYNSSGPVGNGGPDRGAVSIRALRDSGGIYRNHPLEWSDDPFKSGRCG